MISDEPPVFTEEQCETLYGIAKVVLLGELAKTSEPDGMISLHWDDGTTLIALDGTPTGYLDLAKWALAQLTVRDAMDVATSEEGDDA